MYFERLKNAGPLGAYILYSVHVLFAWVPNHVRKVATLLYSSYTVRGIFGSLMVCIHEVFPCFLNG